MSEGVTTVASSIPVYGQLTEDRSDGLNFKLNKNTLIVGKDEDCDICLAEDGVASRHCQIVCKEGSKPKLVKLDSSDGLLVNGKNVVDREVDLSNEDVLSIGGKQLKLKLFDTEGDHYVRAYGRVITLKDKGKGGEGSSYPLKRSLCVFGSGPQCDVKITADGLSAEQCHISAKDGQCPKLVVLASTPSVFLNDDIVEEEADLRNGDVITVGGKRFKFELYHNPGEHSNGGLPEKVCSNDEGNVSMGRQISAEEEVLLTDDEDEDDFEAHQAAEIPVKSEPPSLEPEPSYSGPRKPPKKSRKSDENLINAMEESPQRLSRKTATAVSIELDDADEPDLELLEDSNGPEKELSTRSPIKKERGSRGKISMANEDIVGEENLIDKEEPYLVDLEESDHSLKVKPSVKAEKVGSDSVVETQVGISPKIQPIIVDEDSESKPEEPDEDPMTEEPDEEPMVEEPDAKDEAIDKPESVVDSDSQEEDQLMKEQPEELSPSEVGHDSLTVVDAEAESKESMPVDEKKEVKEEILSEENRRRSSRYKKKNEDDVEQSQEESKDLDAPVEPEIIDDDGPEDSMDVDEAEKEKRVETEDSVEPSAVESAESDGQDEAVEDAASLEAVPSAESNEDGDEDDGTAAEGKGEPTLETEHVEGKDTKADQDDDDDEEEEEEANEEKEEPSLEEADDSKETPKGNSRGGRALRARASTQKKPANPTPKNAAQKTRGKRAATIATTSQRGRRKVEEVEESGKSKVTSPPKRRRTEQASAQSKNTPARQSRRATSSSVKSGSSRRVASKSSSSRAKQASKPASTKRKVSDTRSTSAGATSRNKRSTSTAAGSRTSPSRSRLTADRSPSVATKSANTKTTPSGKSKELAAKPKEETRKVGRPASRIPTKSVRSTRLTAKPDKKAETVKKAPARSSRIAKDAQKDKEPVTAAPASTRKTRSGRGKAEDEGGSVKKAGRSIPTAAKSKKSAPAAKSASSPKTSTNKKYSFRSRK